MSETVEVTLGLDIGTQFCYAGYLYSDDTGTSFFSAFDTGNGVWGIPTDIVYKGVDTNDVLSAIERNAGQYYYAFDAIGARKNKNIYTLDVGCSIKTKMRECMNYDEQILKCPPNNESKNFKMVIEGFLSKVNTLIKHKLDNDFGKRKKGYKIVRIKMAYPNVVEDNESTINGNTYGELSEFRRALSSYCNGMRVLVAKAFGLVDEKTIRDKYIREEDIKKAIESEAINKVDIQTEASYGADIIGRIYKKLAEENITNFPETVITVDIGGGTTDIAFLTKGDQGLYSPRFYGSINFGGKDIDTIVEPVMNKSGQSVSIGPYELLKAKDEMFCGGMKLYNFTNEEKKCCKDKLDNLSGLKSFKPVIINLLRQNSLSTSSPIIFVLMGGSCVLPSIRETIKKIIEDQNINGKIELLEDDNRGKLFGVNNSNFLVWGALTTGTKYSLVKTNEGRIEKKFEYGGLNPDFGYSHCTYAVEFYNKGDKDHPKYLIIAEEGIGEGEKYYFPSISTYVEEGSFVPRNNLFRLWLDPSKPLKGKKEIEKEEVENYLVRGTKPEKIEDGFLCYNGELEGGEKKCYYRATIFNYKESMGKQLQIHVFEDNVLHTEYVDTEKQRKIGYSNFMKKIGDQDTNKEKYIPQTGTVQKKSEQKPIYYEPEKRSRFWWLINVLGIISGIIFIVLGFVIHLAWFVIGIPLLLLETLVGFNQYLKKGHPKHWFKPKN